MLLYLFQFIEMMTQLYFLYYMFYIFLVFFPSFTFSAPSIQVPLSLLSLLLPSLVTFLLSLPPPTFFSGQVFAFEFVYQVNNYTERPRAMKSSVFAAQNQKPTDQAHEKYMFALIYPLIYFRTSEYSEYSNILIHNNCKQ